jgi:hypothetical protein
MIDFINFQIPNKVLLEILFLLTLVNNKLEFKTCLEENFII